MTQGSNALMTRMMMRCVALYSSIKVDLCVERKDPLGNLFLGEPCDEKQLECTSKISTLIPKQWCCGWQEEITTYTNHQHDLLKSHSALTFSQIKPTLPTTSPNSHHHLSYPPSLCMSGNKQDECVDHLPNLHIPPIHLPHI